MPKNTGRGSRHMKGDSVGVFAQLKRLGGGFSRERPSTTIRLAQPDGSTHTMKPREVESATWDSNGNFTMTVPVAAVRKRTVRALKAIRPRRTHTEVYDKAGLVSTYEIRRTTYTRSTRRFVIEAVA